jgi:ABC-type cobalamin/Fe3+-siderophores transport system ATPase subunit
MVLCWNRDRFRIGKPREVLTTEGLQEIYGAPAAFHVHDH